MERKLLNELPGGDRFHSCFMTAFSFNIYYFEEHVLRLLKQKGITNLSVWLEQTILDDILGDLTGNIDKGYDDYTLFGISNQGLFHPKIMLFVGREEFLLLLGSGNLTSTGHGKNQEVWTSIYATEDNPGALKIIYDAWNYLMYLATNIQGIGQVQIQRAIENCKLLQTVPAITTIDFISQGNGDEISFLANDNSGSIYNKLTNLIPANQVNEVSIIAPYFDTKGIAISSIADHFNNAKVNVILPKDSGNPPSKIKLHSRISFYDWEDAELTDVKRKNLHAKIYHFKGDTDEYFMIGSANPSIAGLGIFQTTSFNHEAVILFHSQTTKYLDELSIKIPTKKIKVPESNIKDESENNKIKLQSNYKLTLYSAERKFEKIEIYHKESKIIDEVTCNVYNNRGGLLFSATAKIKDKNLIEINIPAEIRARQIFYLQFFEKGQAISNKVKILDILSIHKTNPSEANRRLVSLIQAYEDTRFDPFKLVSYYNTLVQSTRKEKKTFDSKNTGSESPILEEKKEQEFTVTSYEDFTELVSNKNELDFHHLINNFHTIKIWDAIFAYMRKQMEKSEDVLIDEEETDLNIDLQSGRDNAEEEKYKKERKIPESRLNSTKRQFEKFLDRYKQTLERNIQNDGYELSIVDLSMFLIVTTFLIEITENEIILTREGKEIGRNVLMKRKGVYGQIDNLAGATFTLVGLFVRLCATKHFIKTNDEYIIEKQNHYKNDAWVMIQILISLVLQSFDKEPRISIWSSLLYFNGKMFIEPSVNFDLASKIDTFLHEKDFQGYTKIKALEDLGLLEKKFQNLKKNDKYYLHPTLGYCIVFKHIPPLGKTKFLKLVHPAFPFSQKDFDFVYEELWDITNQKFLKTKQKNKELFTKKLN